MPDPDPSPPARAAKRPHDYPIAPRPATPSLAALLHERITCHGPLAFSDFMAAALYDPQLGYYARAPRQIGRGGDFFTSVSVGPLFGQLLARRFLRDWRDSGSPARWRIIECGAHDGKLAADVLAALATLEPAALVALDYVISEPLPALQAAQRLALAPFQRRVRVIADPLELAADPLPGVAFGNELLDALPFDLVEWRDGHWLECRVALAPDGASLEWQTCPILDHPQLLAALAPLVGPFPDGYRTEIRSNFQAFLHPLARALVSGLVVWLDYGFARPDYYHPLRSAGTLRTFSGHRAGADPLLHPGHSDITAHVDFTAVAEAALALGGRPLLFCNQGSWLTSQARPWLLDQEGSPRPADWRQFQTLTHPAHLGARFHVLELSWNPAASPPDPAHLARHLFPSS